MKRLLVLSMCILLSIGSYAYDCIVNGIYYNLNGNEKTATVTHNNSLYSGSYVGTVTIPTNVTYNGTTYTVTSVGNGAFYLSTDLTSVTIPSSVTSIGNSAFNYCTNLTSVAIPSSVTSIGGSAFYCCKGLTDITIPENITSIGEKVFLGCSGLTCVTIPEKVRNIGNYAFDGCSNLARIIISEGVTNIGISAFAHCPSLTRITIPENVTSINILPESVTSIGTEAFSDCIGLTNITIPNSVTDIGDRAFEGCSGLTSITIPNSVTNLGEQAFRNCPNLVAVTLNSDNVVSKKMFLGDIFGKQVKEYIIGEGVYNIHISAFKGCTNLTSITIPNSVTDIGGGAFYGCSMLNSIIIPNSVTSIGASAFEDCSGLTSVIISENISRIEGRTFYGCSNLTDIAIPQNITSIGNYAFYGCSMLNSIIIPNSVTSIGASAFEDCTNLASIAIPNSVTSIGEDVFYGTAWYENLPDGLVYLGGIAYKYKDNMSKATTIEIKEGTTIIGVKAFSNCTDLTNVIIPKTVTKIHAYAFSGCKSLTSIYCYSEKLSETSSYTYYFHTLFEKDIYNTATLYVPLGTKAKYLAAEGWNNFVNIVEMTLKIVPIVDVTTLAFTESDFVNAYNTPVDLNNTVVNDTYFSINNNSNTDGYYDATEQCIVISKTTANDAMTTVMASELGSTDFISNYTGMVVEVNGAGSIKINAQTVGSNKLAVKIGNAETKTFTQTVKGDVTVNYDVTDNTYVYIYAVDANDQQQSLSMDATDTATENAVKVYSMTVMPDVTAIENVSATIPSAVFGKIYYIDGKQLSQPQKGLNILKMSDGTIIKVVK